MDKKILDFLAKNRISVLTTLLPDGSPHSASLHFSNNNNPFEFYFSTERSSRKCQSLLNGKPGKSSLVVGFSEEDFITLQMEGEVKAILNKEDLEKIHKVHYAKYPDSEKWKNDPGSVFLVFTPKWWRYTEFKPKFFKLESE